MTTGHETIQLRLEHRTAWITLDRPPLNILDIPMMQALDAALEHALPKCDFVIFNGTGSNAFSAGAEVADHTPERVGEMLSAFHAVFRRLAAADCLTRKALGRLHFADFAKQLDEAERVYLSELMQSHDGQEGILAFLEKRAPIWKGR